MHIGRLAAELHRGNPISDMNSSKLLFCCLRDVLLPSRGISLTATFPLTLLCSVAQGIFHALERKPTLNFPPFSTDSLYSSTAPYIFSSNLWLYFPLSLFYFLLLRFLCSFLILSFCVSPCLFFSPAVFPSKCLSCLLTVPFCLR